jgi:hypothetical protein
VQKRKYTPPHYYTAVEIRFLKNYVAGRSYAELAEMFNRRFNTSLCVSQIRGTCGNHGLINGRDCRFLPGTIPPNKGKKGYHPPGCEKGWFKPGHRTHNRQPVGTEIIDEDGYVKVKTRNPKTWKYKHRMIWEQAHGKIPRGHAVLFADGNRLNFALDNLILVNRSELAVMNHLDLISANGDLTRAGKAVADIKLAIADRKWEIKKAKKSRRRKEGGGH